MKFEYRDAVFCQNDEVVPLFLELTNDGFVWASGTKLLKNDTTPNVIDPVIDGCSYIFYLRYDKRVTYATAENLSEALHLENGRVENGVALFDEFMFCTCCVDAEVDVMSVL